VTSLELPAPLSQAVDCLACGLFVADASGPLVYANAWLAERIEAFELSPARFCDLLAPSSREIYQAQSRFVRHTRHPISCELVLLPRLRVTAHLGACRTPQGRDWVCGVILPNDPCYVAKVAAGGIGPLSRCDGTDTHAPTTGAPSTRSLSKRESEVMRLATSGRSVADIAKLLQISASTVRSHLGSVRRKVGQPSER